MKQLTPMILTLALAACGGGGSIPAPRPTPTVAPTPTATPTNTIQPANGQVVTLATCVPVTNQDATGYDPTGPNTFQGQLVVGTACTYIDDKSGFVINDNASVYCEAQTVAAAVIADEQIDAFICQGNPY